MINKVWLSAEAAVADISDGATILFGGFGGAGIPKHLIQALIHRGARNLTGVSNNWGVTDPLLTQLLHNRQMRRILCSYPTGEKGNVFWDKCAAGEFELEVVPQGTLAERLRAAGAGLGGFYTPTGVGTELAAGKETRMIDGREYLLEYPVRGDFALVRAHKADRWGNLVYRKSGRNFNPLIAMAARVTIAEVDKVVPLGALDPEAVVTPGIFVQRVVVRGG